MSPKEKGKFEDMAKLDKVRYEKEMKNYIPPKGHKKKRFKDPNAPKRPPWVPSSTRSLLFYLFDIRYKLDQNSWINDAFFSPNHRSAFFLFCADFRPKVKGDYPGLTIGDTAKKLGEMWNSSSAEDKQPYEKKAAKLKEKYDKVNKPNLTCFFFIW